MRSSSKLKLLRILDIMRKTDEYHPLNTRHIADRLATFGIMAERKSISRDLAVLNDAGFSILRCKEYNKGYYMTDHLFEDHELKLLHDAVAAAPFLTMSDTKALLGKISGLATPEGEQILKASALMDPENKSRDSANKRKMDAILRAIKGKRMLSFQYTYTEQPDSSPLSRRGYRYRVSPYYFVLHHGQYYVIGNTDTNLHLTHYRMDRMVQVACLDEPRRPPAEIPAHGDRFSLAAYMRGAVNMWTGERIMLTLRFSDAAAHAVRQVLSGRSPQLRQQGKTVEATLEVVDGPGLYPWLAGLGPRVTVVAPQQVRDKFAAYVRKMADRYAPGQEGVHE